MNLVVNACDAMPDGGVLRAALRCPDPRHVEVLIGDSGTGIAADELDRIFEPFYSSKTRGQGTGLGLVVAKAIVDGHDGVISVESELGKGTTFTIRLDAAD